MFELNITVEDIKTKLPIIFPEGIENRNYVIREMAAKTIFVMLYVNAIEGQGNRVRPDQITKMTDEQSQKTSVEDRRLWYKKSLSPGKMKNIANRWYAVNTREPIRDETLRLGLVSIGAVLERTDLPTTSSKPRYYLKKEFAELFINNVGIYEIETWREIFFSPETLARVRINAHQRTFVAENHTILVRFPNGETRKMSPGPSSVLSKAVIESFAKKFLKKPALIFLSESGNKVVSQDNDLALSIGLEIQADKNLPDIIMADIGNNRTILVFIEVVASDGPINRVRKEALTNLIEKAGFGLNNVLFITAFQDRSSSVFKRLAPDIAWGSLVWFASEPDHILVYSDNGEYSVEDLLKMIN
jgi:hypothetical protein